MTADKLAPDSEDEEPQAWAHWRSTTRPNGKLRRKIIGWTPIYTNCRHNINDPLICREKACLCNIDECPIWNDLPYADKGINTTQGP